MNVERVEAILRLLNAQPYIGDVAVEGEGWRVHARRGAGPSPLDVPDAAAETLPGEDRRPIRAGRVGIFRASPKAPAIGDHVAQGDEVGSIEAMHIFNPVTADESGFLQQVLVEDGDPVEYGQELFLLTSELDADESAR